MKLLGLLGTRGLELLLFHAILENSSTNYRVALIPGRTGHLKVFY